MNTERGVIIWYWVKSTFKWGWFFSVINYFFWN